MAVSRWLNTSFSANKKSDNESNTQPSNVSNNKSHPSRWCQNGPPCFHLMENRVQFQRPPKTVEKRKEVVLRKEAIEAFEPSSPLLFPQTSTSARTSATRCRCARTESAPTPRARTSAPACRASWPRPNHTSASRPSRRLSSPRRETESMTVGAPAFPSP